MTLIFRSGNKSVQLIIIYWGCLSCCYSYPFGNNKCTLRQLSFEGHLQRRRKTTTWKRRPTKISLLSNLFNWSNQNAYVCLSSAKIFDQNILLVCWAEQEKSQKVELIQVWGGFSWNPRGFRQLRLCHISAPSHPVDSKSRYKNKYRHKLCHISVQGETLQSPCWYQIQIQKQKHMKIQLQKKTK